MYVRTVAYPDREEVSVGVVRSVRVGGKVRQKVIAYLGMAKPGALNRTSVFSTQV